MNRKEEILHQQVAEAWRNSHLPSNPDPNAYRNHQRLICNWANSETGRSGNKARSMGVKKGIADWLYMRENGGVIWIELKTDTGNQSKEQKLFETLCKSLGHEYHICRDYYHFWDIIGVEPPFKLNELLTK